MTFNERLKELRVARGLTQDEFSKQTKIGRSAISMYESGKREPNYETLLKLARFFRVSIDYLLGNTDDYPRAADRPLSIYRVTPNSTEQLVSILRKLVRNGQLDVKSAMLNGVPLEDYIPELRETTPQVPPQDTPQATPHDGEFIKGLLPIDNNSKFSATVKKAMEFYQYYEQLPPDLKSAVDSILLSQRNNEETAETSGKKMSLSKRHAHV